MSEDDIVSSHKHSNTTKSFHLLEIPNTDKNLATIIVFDNSKRKTTGGVNMGVVVQRHLSVYRIKKHKEKIIRKNHMKKHYTLNKQEPVQSNRILPRPYLSLDWDLDPD